MVALTAIDVLLEPDERTRARAMALNAALRGGLPSGFALDETHRPHVTLLQRYVRRDDLEGVFLAVQEVVAARDVAALRLHATAIVGAEFGTSPGTTLASVVIEPTTALRALHEALVVALAPLAASGGSAPAFFTLAGEPAVDAATIAYVEEFVPLHSAGHYSPHMTVGVGRQESVNEMAASPFDDFEFSPRAAAVYQLGDLGAARRVLRSWPLRRP